MLQAGRSLVQFSTRSLVFSFDVIFQPHFGPRVDSAYNRKECQESSWGVKGGRGVNLKISPPSVRKFSRNCGSLDVPQAYEYPLLVTEIAMRFTTLLEKLRKPSTNVTLGMKYECVNTE
jgi:hypothetical protein